MLIEYSEYERMKAEMQSIEEECESKLAMNLETGKRLEYDAMRSAVQDHLMIFEDYSESPMLQKIQLESYSCVKDLYSEMLDRISS